MSRRVWHNRIDNISEKIRKKQNRNSENISRSYLHSKDLGGKSMRDGYAEYSSQQLMRLMGFGVFRMGIVSPSLIVM
jgi:hypothetical protein